MLKNNTKNIIFTILYFTGLILDATTDLMVELLTVLNSPEWVGIVFRMIMVSIGVIKVTPEIQKWKTNLLKIKGNER